MLSLTRPLCVAAVCCGDAQARLLERRAQEQVGLGDMRGAELLLRKAIELQPRDPYLQVTACRAVGMCCGPPLWAVWVGTCVLVVTAVNAIYGGASPGYGRRLG